MTTQTDILADELAVRRLRQQWAFSRDRGDFDAMAACFHPGARASISWFQGLVADLIPMLAGADKARKSVEHSKHLLGNCLVTLNGDRALMETDVSILMREYIDGQLFDYTGHCRFYDQVDRRGGKWAITLWTIIFDKDRLDPVLGAAPDWLHQVEPEPDTSNFAFMKLRQLKKGRQVPPDTIMGGSAAESRLRQGYDAWLQG